MRWRRVLPFAAFLAATTLAKLVLRPQPGLIGAWSWNIRHLPATLTARRDLAARRLIVPERLEAMIDAHNEEQRQHRSIRRARQA
jgi:hypothetical protein